MGFTLNDLGGGAGLHLAARDRGGRVRGQAAGEAGAADRADRDEDHRRPSWRRRGADQKAGQASRGDGGPGVAVQRALPDPGDRGDAGACPRRTTTTSRPCTTGSSPGTGTDARTSGGEWRRADELFAYLDPMFDERIAEPRDDLLSVFCTRGEGRREDDARPDARLRGAAARGRRRHDAQGDRRDVVEPAPELRAVRGGFATDPELMDRVFTEMLRFDGSNHWQRRRAKVEVEIHGRGAARRGRRRGWGWGRGTATSACSRTRTRSTSSGTTCTSGRNCGRGSGRTGSRATSGSGRRRTSAWGTRWRGRSR